MEMNSSTAVSHGNLGVCLTACGQRWLPHAHSCDDGILILFLRRSLSVLDD